MKKILFVCHGNICRSPMAEYVMKDLVQQAGLSDLFQIASAATSTEELGNSIYPPARQELARHNILVSHHQATLLTRQDYRSYDFLIGMDQANLRNMQHICGEDINNKMHLLLEYTGDLRDIQDPWYTDDFQIAYNDIYNGCKAFFETLK